MSEYRVTLTLNVNAPNERTAVREFLATLVNVYEGEKVFRVTPWDSMDGGPSTVLYDPAPLLLGWVHPPHVTGVPMTTQPDARNTP